MIDYDGYQFVHLRNHDQYAVPKARGGTTFALQVPTKSELLKFLGFEDPTIALAFGKARCHSEENYNKAVGRVYAIARAEPKSWTIVNDSHQLMINGRTEYLLQGKEGVSIVLSTSENSERVYFVEAF